MLNIHYDYLVSSHLKDSSPTPFRYPPLGLVSCKPLLRHNSNNNGKSKLIYDMTHVDPTRHLS